MNGLTNSLINEIKAVMETARRNAARQVNSELLTAYWNIGRIVIEHEQENKERAEYGKQALKELSKALTIEFGKGFSVANIQFMRRFYQAYQIQQTVSVKLSWSHYCELLSISDENKRSFYEKERRGYAGFR
jgi:predicted nuclease of restriction endonuclease-like (RecB) superfamily